MAAEVLAHPFMYWVGMDTDPRTTPDALTEFNRFYSTTHVHEVIAAHPGFLGVERYELIEPDARGGEHHGPRWLAMYAMQDEASALQYLKDNERPWLHRKRYSPWPPARKRAKTVWRMIWRQIATRGSVSEPAECVFIVGMQVAAESDAELAAFNNFYTSTHLGEVMAAGGYARGTRLELFRDFGHPTPGCPRFCAVYEGDASATEALRERRDSLSPGPPAWDQRETVWRLVYRRIPPPEDA